MEAEIFDHDICCRDLFHIINMTQYLGNELGLPVRVPLMKVSVQEDNAGVLILARTLTPKFTPHS